MGSGFEQAFFLAANPSAAALCVALEQRHGPHSSLVPSIGCTGWEVRYASAEPIARRARQTAHADEQPVYGQVFRRAAAMRRGGPARRARQTEPARRGAYRRAGARQHRVPFGVARRERRRSGWEALRHRGAARPEPRDPSSGPPACRPHGRQRPAERGRFRKPSRKLRGLHHRRERLRGRHPAEPHRAHPARNRPPVWRRVAHRLRRRNI